MVTQLAIFWSAVYSHDLEVNMSQRLGFSVYLCSSLLYLYFDGLFPFVLIGRSSSLAFLPLALFNVAIAT